MRLITPFSVAVLLLATLSGACHRNAGADAAADSTFRAEKARAEAARDVATQRCETTQPTAARDDCLTRAQAEYGRLVAAAELRRDAREPDLPRRTDDDDSPREEAP